MAIQEHHKNTLITIIKKHLPQAKIWLFGSRAQNREQPGSDIDIAIDNKTPIPWKTITNLLIEIEATTIPATVDLVDLKNCDELLASEIKKKGVLWTLEQ